MSTVSADLDPSQAEENVRRVARLLLTARDMTPPALGRLMGLSNGRIYDRMRGDKAFTVREVAVMAAIFGVPVQVFFEGPDALFAPNAVSPSRGFKSTTNTAPADLAA